MEKNISPSPLALFYEDTFKIRAYEAGPDGRVTIQSVCNYLQEAAASHAVKMGLAMNSLIKENMTWVLSRLHIRMNEYPFWLDAIRIETWPAVKDKYFAIRDFRLFNSAGKKIGTASSSWMIIDTVSRKPVALPSYMDGFQNEQKHRALKDPFEKLPKAQNAEYEKHFNVRLGDLDMNRHVNSVHYLAWGMETVPKEVWQGYLLSDVEINYRFECYYGQSIISRSEKQENEAGLTFIHQLFREDDGREITRLRSSWLPK